MSQGIVQPLPVGLVLGDEFRIERALGRGTFGITYCVLALKDVDTRIRTGRRYVVKELAMADCVCRSRDGVGLEPLGANDDDRRSLWAYFSEQVQKFDDEARMLARFQHLNIVEVLLIRRANNTAYIVMEFIDGEQLSDGIGRAVGARGAGLTWPEFEPIAADLITALDFVHRQDIIHRDIKPLNIMLRSTGEAVLIDFGGAREGARASGSMVLSPGFAPIEQIYNLRHARDPNAKLAPITPATDIYGMAATFYMAMVGEAPYATTQALDRAEHRRPLTQHPKRKQLNIPTQVAEAIDWALNFENAAARPQTVSAWRAAFPSLRRPAPGGGSTPPDPAPPGQDARALFAEAEALRNRSPSGEQTVHKMLLLYEKAGAAGLAEAYYRLGRIYQAGRLVPENGATAEKYFAAAAEAEDARACFRLAEIHMNSQAGQQSLKRAFGYARRAADGGFAPAINLIGRFYRKGLHVPQNDEMACDWYERALRHGSPEGAYNLAAMYRRGLGRPKDLALSQHLDRAAERLRSGADPGDVLSDTPPLVKSRT